MEQFGELLVTIEAVEADVRHVASAQSAKCRCRRGTPSILTAPLNLARLPALNSAALREPLDPRPPLVALVLPVTAFASGNPVEALYQLDAHDVLRVLV